MSFLSKLFDRTNQKPASHVPRPHASAAPVPRMDGGLPMQEQLQWIRDAHTSVSRAASIEAVRGALTVVLGQFKGTGLTMPVGLLTELSGKARSASGADLGSLKRDISEALVNMERVHGAMLNLAASTKARH